MKKPASHTQSLLANVIRDARYVPTVSLYGTPDPRPPAYYRQQQVPDDDESTVLGTDVPFVGSRDGHYCGGEEGVQQTESVFQTRVLLPGVAKNAAMIQEMMMMSRFVR